MVSDDDAGQRPVIKAVHDHFVLSLAKNAF